MKTIVMGVKEVGCCSELRYNTSYDIIDKCYSKNHKYVIIAEYIKITEILSIQGFLLFW